MSEAQPRADGTVDLGEYCRRVEDHLTRANAGHLVRIVGPGFELVRQWAATGVPLSVVYRGIDLKAERHREGASKRPLRIEFCAGDVQTLFDHWRRAVGLMAIAQDAAEDVEPDAGSAEKSASKRPSMGRHIDRAIDRLSRVAARVDLPEAMRADCTRVMEALAILRETAAGARGPAREQAEGVLASLDTELSAAARRNAPAEWMTTLRIEAAADLAPFRSRLTGEAWERSMSATVDRLLRDRLGLPVLTL